MDATIFAIVATYVRSGLLILLLALIVVAIMAIATQNINNIGGFFVFLLKLLGRLFRCLFAFWAFFLMTYVCIDLIKSALSGGLGNFIGCCFASIILIPFWIIAGLATFRSFVCLMFWEEEFFDFW